MPCWRGRGRVTMVGGSSAGLLARRGDGDDGASRRRGAGRGSVRRAACLANSFQRRTSAPQHQTTPSPPAHSLPRTCICLPSCSLEYAFIGPAGLSRERCQARLLRARLWPGVGRAQESNTNCARAGITAAGLSKPPSLAGRQGRARLPQQSAGDTEPCCTRGAADGRVRVPANRGAPSSHGSSPLSAACGETLARRRGLQLRQHTTAGGDASAWQRGGMKHEACGLLPLARLSNREL